MNPANPAQTIDNNLTLQHVFSRLQDYDVLNRRTDSSKSQDESNFTHEKGNKNATAERAKGSFSLDFCCFNCGGYGHSPRQCSSPQRKKDDPEPPHLAEVKEKIKKKKGKTSKKHKNKPITAQDSSSHLQESSSHVDEDWCDYVDIDESHLLETKHASICDGGTTTTLFHDLNYFDKTSFTWHPEPRSLGTYNTSGENSQVKDVVGYGPASFSVEIDGKKTAIHLQEHYMSQKPLGPY